MSDEESENEMKNPIENSKSLPKIGEVRLVEYLDKLTGIKKEYPGIVVKRKVKNGEKGYMLKFTDSERLWFVPLEELLLCPIQNENSDQSNTPDPMEIEIEENDPPPKLVNRSRSRSSSRNRKILNEDIEKYCIEREREILSLLEEENDDHSDLEVIPSVPVVFDIDEDCKSENEKELVPVLGHEYDQYFGSKKQEKKSQEKEIKKSKLKIQTRKCRQRTHIPKKPDEKRTCSCFIGSKMSHMPCGPHGPPNSKRDCWQ